MSKLIMWNLVTLDGYFEGPAPWDLAFHEDAWGDDLSELSKQQLASAETIVYGRVTYEGMAQYWSTAKGATAEAMNRIPKIVFSRSLQTAAWNNTTLVNGDAAEEAARLKQRPGKDLFIFGSAKLSDTFTRHDLIDEYRLCVAPVLLGAGTPLFKGGVDKKKLTLLDAQPLKSGAVVLRYAPKRA